MGSYIFEHLKERYTEKKNRSNKNFCWNKYHVIFISKWFLVAIARVWLPRENGKQKQTNCSHRYAFQNEPDVSNYTMKFTGTRSIPFPRLCYSKLSLLFLFEAQPPQINISQVLHLRIIDYTYLLIFHCQPHHYNFNARRTLILNNICYASVKIVY